MMHVHSLLPISALVISLLACGTSNPAGLATATSLFSSIPSPVPSATLQTEPSLPPVTMTNLPSDRPEFTVAVMVDTTTEQVTLEQAQAVIDEAGKFLREFSPFGLNMVDIINDGSGESSANLAGRYIIARSGALPNGIIIFSAGDNGEASSSGGYGFSLPGPAGFKNTFVSPAVGNGMLYVAVVDYGYKYMACGYGGSATASSTVALPGECRGKIGVACVSHNGYSMCSNAVGNLYTSTPTHAVSSMIVHGLLHNFGPNGDQDHYATPQCNARMGYPAAFFDLQESEYYNGLCPFVYEEFTKAYQP